MFDDIDCLSRDAAVSALLKVKGQPIVNFGESQPAASSSANQYLAISYKIQLLNSGVTDPTTAFLSLRFLDVYHAKDFWRYGFFVVTNSTSNNILDVFTLDTLPSSESVTYSLDLSSYTTDIDVYVVTPPRNASNIFWQDDYLIQYLGNPTYYKLLALSGQVPVTSATCPFYLLLLHL